MKAIIFTIFMIFFTGCYDSNNDSNEIQNSSITPQPSVTDESLRPPKPPSI